MTNCRESSTNSSSAWKRAPTLLHTGHHDFSMRMIPGLCSEAISRRPSLNFFQWTLSPKKLGVLMKGGLLKNNTVESVSRQLVSYVAETRGTEMLPLPPRHSQHKRVPMNPPSLLPPSAPPRASITHNYFVPSQFPCIRLSGGESPLREDPAIPADLGSFFAEQKSS